MLDYAQIHIFDAVTTCGRYQGRLLLILTLHNVMHDITSTLPVGVIHPLGLHAKWPPHVNRRRAPGVIWLGFTGYVYTYLVCCNFHAGIVIVTLGYLDDQRKLAGMCAHQLLDAADKHTK